MINKKLSFLAIFSLLFSLFFVKSVFADNISSTVWFDQSSFTPLYLDSGFLGHTFTLDLKELHLKVVFRKGDIPHPGVLTILTKGSGSEDPDILRKRKYSLFWTTNYAEKPEIMRVELNDDNCGVDNYNHCVIKEEYQGETIIHKIEKPVQGKAIGFVHLNSTFYLTEIKGWMTHGDASWYAYKNCFCAASPDFPKGSYVKVINQNKPEKEIVVRINDYGPERDIFPNRVIDLDKIAFQELASLSQGVVQVKVEPVSDEYAQNFLSKYSTSCSEEVKGYQKEEKKTVENQELELKSNQTPTQDGIDWEY